MRILPEILLITAGLSLGFFIASGLVAVSYTHLTLPTN